MWNDCIKIFENGDFVADTDMNMFNSFQRYINVIRHEPKLQVWYDAENDKCFGPEQDFYANPSDFSFFAQRENFDSNPRWGKEHLLNYLGKPFGTDITETQEYMIQNFKGLDKFKDKTLLLIGGGPSTDEVDWQSFDIKYDYVWSCNNFFMRTDIEDLKVSFASLGPTVNLQDIRLAEYIEKHGTICGFEAGISPFREYEALKSFKDKYPNQSVYYHLRYFSKLGTLARMVCLATFLEAKKVYFVGMDGYPGKEGNKYTHAFEGPTKEHQGRVFSYHIHKRQYVLLWDYLLNTLADNNTKYQNLGEGHPANQSSNISKKEFPLIK